MRGESISPLALTPGCSLWDIPPAAKSHAGRVTHIRRHSRKKNNYAVAGIDVMVFFRML